MGCTVVLIFNISESSRTTTFPEPKTVSVVKVANPALKYILAELVSDVSCKVRVKSVLPPVPLYTKIVFTIAVASEGHV